MSEIRKYVIVTNANVEDDYEYDDPNEAIENAAKRGLTAVIARIYTFDDSELVWTSTGDNTWPPTTHSLKGTS